MQFSAEKSADNYSSILDEKTNRRGLKVPQFRINILPKYTTLKFFCFRWEKMHRPCSEKNRRGQHGDIRIDIKRPFVRICVSTSVILKG